MRKFAFITALMMICFSFTSCSKQEKMTGDCNKMECECEGVCGCSANCPCKSKS